MEEGLVGLGDEVMVTGQARALQKHDPRPVVVMDKKGRPRWHSLWRGNPRLAFPDTLDLSRFQIISNGPGCRPYVDYGLMARDFDAIYPGRPFTTKVRDVRLPWRYTKWRCSPGELPCIKRMPSSRYVVVEPHGKDRGNPNKIWGWDRWQALVDLNKDILWVQLGPHWTQILDGVRHLVTPTFEGACAALSGASAAVLPDGGLHHAAAALGIPAIVIWGGISSPVNLGYDSHINLFESMEGESPCGQWVPCKHCKAAMAAIKPDAVIAQLRVLGGCS